MAPAGATAPRLLNVAVDGLQTPRSVIPFGTPGDVPVTGDWDGNGITDVGVYDPVTGQFAERTAPSISLVRAHVRRVGFAHARLPKRHH